VSKELGHSSRHDLFKENNDLVSLQELHWLEVDPIQFSQEGSQRLQTPELLKYPLGQVERH
jgi:hypothetical protein